MFCVAETLQANNVIETIPELYNSVFASGLENLTLKAKFDKTDYDSACTWNVRGKSPSDLGVDQMTIFRPGLPCIHSSICHEESIDNVTFIITHLTIISPINYVVEAFITCLSPEIIASWYGTPKSKIMNIT